jgi:hypothetical protein
MHIEMQNKTELALKNERKIELPKPDKKATKKYFFIFFEKDSCIF